MSENSSNQCGVIRERPAWARTGSSYVRGLHLAGAGTMLGAYVFDKQGELGILIIGGIVFTGVLLVAVEMWRHVHWYREFAGVSTLAKLILIGIAGYFPQFALYFVLAAFLIAAVVSHFPRRYRHRLIF